MLPILYRDDHLIAVAKPSGLLVHRTVLDFHETRFALQILRDQIGQRVYPVHRLDKGTSGVLVFGLDQDSARRLGQSFEARETRKTYLAVVRGHAPESGEIDHALSRRPDGAEYRDERAGFEPQPAQTRYRRLAQVELPWPVDRYATSRYSLVELTPLTGRRHQLRRHMKHISHPIIGDATFGKGRHNRLFLEHFGCGRLLLAAMELCLPHPVTGAPLTLTAPLASDFAAVLDHLGWRTALPEQWRQDDGNTAVSAINAEV